VRCLRGRVQGFTFALRLGARLALFSARELQ
jgi:hypothetical protein